jgi:dCMP deaminase
MVLRITRDQMLMQMAQVVAKRGTCSRAQVGAVVSRDGRIIAMGYNGAPAGIPHCDHTNEFFKFELGHNLLEDLDYSLMTTPGKIMSSPQPTEIVDAGCQVAVHAEQNAIAFAAKYGLALDGGDLHCTHAPCINCARSIINAGIKRVFFAIPYRLTEGVELLHLGGLEVFDMGDDVR